MPPSLSECFRSVRFGLTELSTESGGSTSWPTTADALRLACWLLEGLLSARAFGSDLNHSSPMRTPD